jgi:hypothetical protein
MQEPLIAAERAPTREITFEEAFGEVERSAQAAVKAGKQLVSAARALEKAAVEGDIAKIRRASDRLGAATTSARQDIANAREAWPFRDGEENVQFAASYAQELQDEAGREGLKIYERDARLLAYPSILQVLPSDLAVRVDKKRITAIRPTHLVRVLLANQNKKARYPVEKFVESLFDAYKIIEHDWQTGPTMKLSRVYNAFTLLPGASNDYSKSDFSRDLFMLDQSGVNRTKSGHRLTLPASTATRGSKSDLFTFVAPNGEIATYYGIRFTEG